MARSKYIQSVLKAAGGRPKSTQWFRDKIKEFGTPNSSDLIRDGKRTSVPTFGILNMFVYDPKLKDKLPYYDTFPLVLPIERIPGGFAGINFHYLRPGARFTLLERLQRFAVRNEVSSRNRFDVSYNRVKGIPLVKNAIKKYLFSQLRSNFLRIDYDEAALAVYLPVAQFKKGSPY